MTPLTMLLPFPRWLLWSAMFLARSAVAKMLVVATMKRKKLASPTNQFFSMDLSAMKTQHVLNAKLMVVMVRNVGVTT